MTYLETLPTTILFVILDGFQRFVVALSFAATEDTELDAELACKKKICWLKVQKYTIKVIKK